MQNLARKIIHIDMDCFYAAIEMRDNKFPSDKPIAVGGDSRRSVLCTANYAARQFGVRAAMPASKAMQLCPQLEIVPVHMDLYKRESQEIFKIFHDYTPLVQGLSLDEAFLDVSEATACKGSATLIAQEIRKRIRTERQLTASAGVGPSKFIAKIASDLNKPDGQFVVTPEQVPGFVEKLPVEKIWGVGQKTAEKLHTLGLRLCSDVQAQTEDFLVSHFGKFGTELYNLSRGVDHRPVSTDNLRKSYSLEHTFEQDMMHVDAEAEFQILLRRLFVSLQNFLRKNPHYAIKTACVKIKFNDFYSTTVERPWKGCDLNHFLELFHLACQRHGNRIRLLGAGVKFYDESNSSDNQLDFLNILFKG